MKRSTYFVHTDTVMRCTACEHLATNPPMTYAVKQSEEGTHITIHMICPSCEAVDKMVPVDEPVYCYEYLANGTEKS